MLKLIKKTARTTAYHTVYGQLIYNFLLFSQVWVDKRNPTWYPSRVRVSTGWWRMTRWRSAASPTS